MTHTPGPWRHDRDSSRIVSETAFTDYSTPEDPEPVSVVSLFGAMGGDDTAADAALMAAAPAMLAARQNALPWLIKAHIDGAFNGCALPLGGQKAYEQIERAIAAATGER